jgi:DNA-binding CsgD family transcriptional regulator
VKAWKYPFSIRLLLSWGRAADTLVRPMALVVENWEAINRCLLRLYRELDSHRHSRLMLELLNELVPVDSASVNRFIPPDKLTAVVFPENVATPEQISLVGRYSYQSPYAYYLATQDASWKMTTDFMPMEDYRKLDFHRLALKPLGANYQLGGLLMLMDQTAHMITLHRTHTNFTEREREIVNMLHPHLVTSYINAIIHTRAGNSTAQIKAVMETAPGAYGCFDASGKVAWFQEKAEACLREFFPSEAMHQEFIPHRVQELVLESMREGSTPKQLTQTKGDEILVICLGASPVGGWIMRLERKPRTPLPRFRPLPQLSKRKNEVAKWMVEGKRNAEIAAILSLSPRTVEKHVSEILTALNAENRASAILAAMEFCAGANAA